MSDLINVYNQYYGDIILVAIKILVGIILIINIQQKYTKLKYTITVTYSTTMLGMVIFGYLSNNLFINILGLIVGLMVGGLVSRFSFRENIIIYLLFFIYYYVLLECFLKMAGIDFTEIFKGMSYYDIDYYGVGISCGMAIVLALVTIKILQKKNKLIKLIDENKYFWIGNFIIVGGIMQLQLFPVYGISEWSELAMILLNGFYSRETYAIVLLELIALLISRICKHNKAYNKTT